MQAEVRLREAKDYTFRQNQHKNDTRQKRKTDMSVLAFQHSEKYLERLPVFFLQLKIVNRSQKRLLRIKTEKRACLRTGTGQSV